MIRIVTIDGDHLDALIAGHYGVSATAGALEAVMLANPGLAAYGPALPGGLTLEFPDLPAVDQPTLRLWE